MGPIAPYPRVRGQGCNHLCHRAMQPVTASAVRGLKGRRPSSVLTRALVRLHAVTIAFSGVVAIVETPQHVTPNAPQVGGSVIRCGSGRFHAWCPYAKPSAVLIPPRLTSHSPDATCAFCVARRRGRFQSESRRGSPRPRGIVAAGFRPVLGMRGVLALRELRLSVVQLRLSAWPRCEFVV